MSIWWKIFSIIFIFCLVLYFISNFSNDFNFEIEILVNKINSILGKADPFKASLAPIQEFVNPTFRGPTSESTAPENNFQNETLENVLENDLENIPPESIINYETTQELTEQPNIQDQIDDIYEKLDILSQEVEGLRQQELEQQRLEDEKKAEELKKQDEKKEKETEEVQQKTEEKTETTKPTTVYKSSSGFVPSPADLQAKQKLLIIAIQTGGDKSSYDFIQLYNPNSTNVYLKPYRLVKRAKTSSSDTTIKSWLREEDAIILAQGYYLWANSEDNYNIKIFADSATSQTLADDNGVAIRFGSEDTGEIIDALGWGSFNNVLFEGAPPLPPNLLKNKSLERKKNSDGSFIDTDNNQQDFIIQNNPHTINSRNQASIFDPVPTETTLEIVAPLDNPTQLTEASFNFTANKEGSFFQCSFDDGPLELCTQPKNYSNLGVGLHKFQVFATDTNSIADETPAEYSWEIISPPPEEVPPENGGQPEETPPEKIPEEETPEESPENSHFLITEVQIEGEKSSNDFIEIYNPNNIDLDISNYKLRKKTSTGTESSVRVFPDGSKISANSYFLWANSDEDFYLSLNADVWSTATLAKNNSIAILTPEDSIIDALSWGESDDSFMETASFVVSEENKNPDKNQSIERKKDETGCYIDTDNNSQDFFLQEAPNPKN